MDIQRKGSAVWEGDLTSGRGTVSTESGVLAHSAYSFRTRMENQPGTNPEELLAAAHAGCFSMALSAELAAHGLKAQKIETEASVALRREAGGFSIPTVHLKLVAHIPGADHAAFEKAAQAAKAGCPVSKLFRADVTLDAKLEA